MGLFDWGRHKSAEAEDERADRRMLKLFEEESHLPADPALEEENQRLDRAAIRLITSPHDMEESKPDDSPLRLEG